MAIFVFGSNCMGIHGAGSARLAVEAYGAKFRVGEGPTGNAYAIPTKKTPYEKRSLEEVKVSVNRFLEYARSHSELKFLVVRIGCGLAGFTDDQMAPLFADAPENCSFDPQWARYGLKLWEEEPSRD